MTQTNEEKATEQSSEILEAYLRGYTRPRDPHGYCGCDQNSKLLIKWWLIGQADSLI